MKIEQVIYMLRKLQAEMICQDRNAESEALGIADEVISKKLTEEKVSASNRRVSTPNTRTHGGASQRSTEGRGIRAGTLAIK